MHRAADKWIDPRFVAITAAAVLFILYGSLYPFHFSNRLGSPLKALLSTYSERTTRSDVLSNLLLYFPLGFFAIQIFRAYPARRYVLSVTAAAAGLSFAIELIQFYDKSRVSSMDDVYANTMGTSAGAITAVVVGWRWRAALDAPKRRHYFVLLLLACWLAYRLFPYVPTIDPHQYWAALKPLSFSPKLSAQALYRHFVTGLAVAVLLGELVGVARSRLLVPASLLAALCVRVTITGLALSPAEVAGTVAAAVVWSGLVSHLRWRIPLVALLFAAMIAVQSLEPFQFLPVPRPFSWVPFRGFLRGSPAVNLLSLFEKTFTYGTAVWLLERCGWRLWMAAAAAAGFVMVLRFCQMYLPGRSAEITDTIMVLLLAGLMGLLEPQEKQTNLTRAIQ